jgi:hypothetical protein
MFGIMRYSGALQMYWYGLWALGFAAFSYYLHAGGVRTRMAGILILSVAYLFVVHGVYESNHRYHGPLSGVLATLVSFLAYQFGENTRREERSDE